MNPSNEPLSTRKPQVVVVGDTLIDILLYVPAYPKEGSEVKAASFFRVGGSSFTSAMCCHRLGCPTALLSRIGEDLYGRWIREELERMGGILPGMEISPESKTGSMTIVVSEQGQRTMYSCRGTGTLPELDASFNRWRVPGGLLHLSGYSLLESDHSVQIKSLVQQAQARGMRISLDPGPLPVIQVPDRLWEILAWVDVFMPNEMELEELTGYEDEERAAEQVLKTGCKAVLLKKGSKGASMFTDGQRRDAPAEPIHPSPHDTTGAGDSFNGGFLAAMAQGSSWMACMDMGNQTARNYLIKRFNE
jgi:sugar/nucleoside kinase (ribokinase family)